MYTGKRFRKSRNQFFLEKLDHEIGKKIDFFPDTPPTTTENVKKLTYNFATTVYIVSKKLCKIFRHVRLHFHENKSAIVPNIWSGKQKVSKKILSLIAWAVRVAPTSAVPRSRLVYI